MMLGKPKHAPGSFSRPGRWATEREMEAIVYLAASEAPVASSAIGLDLAHDRETRGAGAIQQRGAAIMKALEQAGIVARSGAGHHALTERGRIAAALILAREPAMLVAFFDIDDETDIAR